MQLYADPAAFLRAYADTTDFPTDGIDATEINKLFVFANYMKLLLVFLNQPSCNREHAILLTVRITEGRYANYTFGGGASAFTKRRIKIFQKEGGTLNMSLL